MADKGMTEKAVATNDLETTILKNDIETGTVEECVPTTKRGLLSRHAQMLAIGGTIGTGLFVGSGQALAAGGPAFLFFGYLIMTLLVFGIVTAAAEMGSYLPVEGTSMAYYGSRFVSPSLGFAMGWLYWYSFTIIAPYEITAAGIIVDYWPNSVPIAVWITIFMVVIIALNCCPVKVYGETEFWFASLKVFMIIGLLILSVILFFGGGPSHDRLGFRYWAEEPAKEKYTEGAAGRFCAFLYVIIYTTFSFNFTPELLVITAGEMKAPRRNMPTAARRFFYRLLVFYVGGAFAIGVIVSSNNPNFVSGGGAKASPWVIAIKDAGIHGLDSVVNAVIITSAWSSGNSYLYMSTRSLYSLARSGNAPKIFTRCTKGGVPYMALIVTYPWLCLAYLNVSNSGGVVFNGFINITNTAGFTSWVCCCVVYLRFRQACTVQAITKLPYRSFLQPYISYVCGISFAILCLLNGFGVFPSGNWDASTFLTSYIGLPVFFALYLGHRFFKRQDPWAIRPVDVDLMSGTAELDLMDELDQEKMTEHGNTWTDKVKILWE